VLLSKIPDSTKMMLHYEKQNTVKLIISSGWSLCVHRIVLLTTWCLWCKPDTPSTYIYIYIYIYTLGHKLGTTSFSLQLKYFSQMCEKTCSYAQQSLLWMNSNKCCKLISFHLRTRLNVFWSCKFFLTEVQTETIST
jgi:hypothetical protein